MCVLLQVSIKENKIAQMRRNKKNTEIIQYLRHYINKLAMDLL